MKNFTTKTSSGFALLFSILIISVIATVAFGLASIVYKQKLLTSVAVDSGKAFYMADSGMECTLYALTAVSDSATTGLECLDPSPNSTLSILSMSKNNPPIPLEQFVDPLHVGSALPCFTIEPIFLVLPGGNAFESAKVRGYSTCDTSSPRHLERTLQVFFQ